MKAVAFKFNGKTVQAERVAERQAARMVTNISGETMDALRVLIARSVRMGIPPYDAARAIKPMIGLTTQAANAALNYRTELIDAGHSLERVNTLVDRYVQKKLRERSITIARTETMNALNAGQLESWNQAVQQGLLGSQSVKEATVTPDERLCPICAPMEGVTVPLNEPFKVGGTTVMSPPFHVKCRCSMGVISKGKVVARAGAKVA